MNTHTVYVAGHRGMVGSAIVRQLLAAGQPASHTTRPRSPFSSTFTSGFPPSFQSRVVGVGQADSPEEGSLPDVRRADAR